MMSRHLVINGGEEVGLKKISTIEKNIFSSRERERESFCLEVCRQKIITMHMYVDKFFSVI